MTARQSLIAAALLARHGKTACNPRPRPDWLAWRRRRDRRMAKDSDRQSKALRAAHAAWWPSWLTEAMSNWWLRSSLSNDRSFAIPSRR